MRFNRHHIEYQEYIKHEHGHKNYLSKKVILKTGWMCSMCKLKKHLKQTQPHILTTGIKYSNKSLKFSSKTIKVGLTLFPRAMAASNSGFTAV
jgi:hypothetical protein